MNTFKETAKNLAMGNDSSMGRSSIRLGRMRDISELSIGDIRRNDRGSRRTRRSTLPRRSSSTKGSSQHSLPARTASGSGILKKQTLQDSLASIDDILNGSTGADNSSRRSSSRRMPVTFDTAEIREYPVILDSSREGPALTIDWNHSSAEFTTVDLHKEAKKMSPARCLDPAERTIILLESGTVSKVKLLRHLSNDSLASMDKSTKGSTRRAGKKPISTTDSSSSSSSKSKDWERATKNGSKNKADTVENNKKTVYSKMKVAALKMVL